MVVWTAPTPAPPFWVDEMVPLGNKAVEEVGKALTPAPPLGEVTVTGVVTVAVVVTTEVIVLPLLTMVLVETPMEIPIEIEM